MMLQFFLQFYCCLPRKTQKIDKQIAKKAAETLRIGGLNICLNGFIEPFLRELPRKKRQISTIIAAPVEKQLTICEICTNLCVLLNLSEISLKSHFYTDKIWFKYALYVPINQTW